MAELRMGQIKISGSIEFDELPLETYNKLVALIDGFMKPEPPKEESPKKNRSDKLVAFGEKLRLARLEHKLSRKELASMIGYSPITVGTWEIGACTPSNLAIDNLRRVFPEANFEYLL